MGTIVDSLLVTLGIDTKDFDKAREGISQGLKDTSEEAKKRGGETEESAKRMGLAFAKLRGEVLGLFAAFAGAKTITQFAISTVQATAQVGRTAQVMGMSTNTVNAWGDAIKAAGGDASEAAAFFGKVADIRADFIRNPGNLNMPLMGQLGIRSRDAFNDPEKLMYHLADQYQAELSRAKASGDPNAEATVQATFRQRSKELLGLSDNWIAMIERGRPALQREIELYKQKDKVTREDAEAARQTVEAFTHLQKSLVGLFRAIGGVQAIETVAELLDLLSGNSQEAGEHLKIFGLGLWGVMHPLDSLVAILANKGLISKGVADFIMAGDKPWAWTTAAPTTVPGALGNPSNQNTPYVSNTGKGKLTRADRNNNPGNLEASPWTRRQPGYVGTDGRFAIFSTPEAGEAAHAALVASYGRRGHTIGSMVARYAPGSDNNNVGAYVASVSKATGLSPNARVTDSNARAIAAAMARHEGYHGGVRRAMGGTGGARGGNTSVQVHVDARGATDPHKVATATGNAVKHALRNRHRVANANTGVN